MVFVIWFVSPLSVNLQTALLTPPFGFALFCTRPIMPEAITMSQLYRGIVPFVPLQFVGLTLTVLFPELVLWPPRAAGPLD